MATFNVYLGKKIIDRVWHHDPATSDEVQRSLVNHDGYDPRIIVRKVHVPKSEIVSGSARFPRRNPAPKTRNHPRELSVADEPLAYELASAIRSLLPNKEQLVTHLQKTAKKPGFDRERYYEFLAKTWAMPAAERYYGSKVEAKRFATLPVRRLAGELYVDHVLSGEWA